MSEMFFKKYKVFGVRFTRELHAKFSKPSLLSVLQYSEKINVAFIIDRCVFNCQAERSSARRSFKHQTHRTIFEKNISQSVERLWTYMDFA